MLGILLEICQEAIILIFYCNVENDFDMTLTLKESLFVCMRSFFIIKSLLWSSLKFGKKIMDIRYECDFMKSCNYKYSS